MKIFSTRVGVRLKLILGMMMTFFVTSQSQNITSLYFMPNLPQSNDYNPAIIPDYDLYITPPVLGGIGLNYYSDFTFESVFSVQPDGSVHIPINTQQEITDFRDRVDDNLALSLQARIDMFAYGKRNKNNFWKVDWKKRFYSEISLPLEIFDLLNIGAGNQISIPNLTLNTQLYDEIGYTYSWKYDKKLTLGFRGKLLSGKFYMGAYMKEFNAVSSVENLSANIDARLRLSGLLGASISGGNPSIDYSGDNPLNYIIGFRNPGIGADFGAVYQLNKQVKLYMDISDLGFIYWSKMASGFNAGGDGSFKGFDESVYFSGENYINQTADSLLNLFDIKESANSFFTSIRPTISFGGEYKLENDISLGLLFQGQFLSDRLKSGVNLSVNYNSVYPVSASLRYKYGINAPSAFGASLAYRIGFVQLYSAADLVSLQYNTIISNNNSFRLPASLDYINFRAGLNLVFGARKKQWNNPCQGIIQGRKIDLY